MVYFSNFDSHPTPKPFNTGLLESEGRGLVSPLAVHGTDYFYIRIPNGKPWYKAIVSIVICTYGRPESLNDTLTSLTQQTFKNFEVILITEKGNLSELRDKGLRSAKGDIVSFIDDDVYCPPTWLEGVIKSFRQGVVGVTGPTTITSEYQKNRDSIKYEKLSKLLGWMFKVPTDPGKLSPCGTPSMASNFETSYQGDVEYLECCNMSVWKETAINVGGFDHTYYKTSEWCEVDLAMAMAKKGKLIYSKKCELFHRPSKAGIYTARIDIKHRWFNFMHFQLKWIKPSFLTYTYRGFVWIYLKMKSLRMI